MRSVLILFLTLAVVGLFEAGWHLVRYFSSRRLGQMRKRLRVGADPVRADLLLLRQGRFASIHALDYWLSTQPWARHLEHLMEQADSRLTVAQFCGVSILGALIGALAGFWLGSLPGLVLAVVGLFTPRMVLLAARERRSRMITKQLPEALDMMARSLRAGHALSAAFELVATELPEPVAVEFARAFEEQKLGMPLDRVVLEMAARAPNNRDLKIFAVSAVIQKETGGNLAEILEGIATTIRERYRFFGKLRALTAEGRATAWFVSLTPLVLFASFLVIQPGYVKPLLVQATGRETLGVGIVTWIAGVLWFKKLTQFRY
jgi:tight adherence protein B